MSATDGRTTTMTDQDPQRCARRVHPLNTVVGLAFLAVVGLWLAADRDVLQGRDVGPAVAVALIVLGTAGVAGTLLVGRRGRAASVPPAAPAARHDEHDEPDLDRTAEAGPDPDGHGPR